jgi:sugar phosphate isomerase/epimerase
MRLGGPIFQKCDSPDAWAQAVRGEGYTAAVAPVAEDAPDELLDAYCKAARRHDVMIAEVGAWGANPLHPDDSVRAAGLQKVKNRLRQADRLGARCCLNIAGMTFQRAENESVPNQLSDDVFDLIVRSVREILDDVSPTRTYFALETMPWLLPHTVEAYVRLVDAIDRERFGVHLDPVNLITSPALYYDTASLIREFCSRLGPRVRSCHAKDIVLRNELTVHLDETCPGRGRLDYATYLREIDRLDPQMPLIIEHLSGPEEYREAADYIRSVQRAME